MPALPENREAGGGLVKVDGQGAVDGVTGGEERKTLVKRAFRACPSSTSSILRSNSPIAFALEPRDVVVGVARYSR